MNMKKKLNKSDADKRTVLDIFNAMDEEQKKVVYFLVGESIDETKRKYSDSKIRMKIIKNLILKTDISFSKIAEITEVSVGYIYKINRDMKDKGDN